MPSDSQRNKRLCQRHIFEDYEKEALTLNLKQYCEQTRLTPKQFIERASTVAPKYSKIVHSMCCNEKYGCVPAPAVMALFPSPETKPNRKHENRKKPNRFNFRLGHELAAQFHFARMANGHDVQTAAECAVRLYIEKAALEAGTSKTADDNNTTESITESEANVNV